ncbi:MAG: NAD-dependent epimerase/dehydratase family protein [Pirellulales bacterium]|nr:NAD-dependent epimerase/dehydratase family protein [Pirellulales bacterium]
MNALVTGAGGFLGRYIVEKLLARGDRVRAMVRRPTPELSVLGVETVLADLCDWSATVAACRGVDCVFHTAGLAGIGLIWKPFFETNCLGTSAVIDGCQIYGVRRLVYTSSPCVVFEENDLCGIDESAPYSTRWLCPYAWSKALAEQMVLESNGQQELFTCALRPHLIFGPRDRALFPKIVSRARRGRLYRVGDGTNRIDVTYVENAADAHLQAADALTSGSPVAGRAYFISQGEPVNCWRWIDRLLGVTGLPPVKKTFSFRAAWRLGAGFEIFYKLFRLQGEPPMTRFLAAHLARSHYFDITRAKTDFGYHPAVSTEEGLCRMAEGAGGG